MTEQSASPNFAEYLSVGEAAEFLGVSTATLRNWDRSGKLRPRRHPQNGYRIYLHEDLEAVLRSADLSTLTDESFAPQVDWREMRDTEHFVQFYENDEYLVDAVSGFVGAALAEANRSIIIATPEHRSAIQRKLLACGVDIPGALSSGQYVVLDARETLSQFMVEGQPDRQRFRDTVGAVIERLAEAGGRIHAFGEMVALLWADGNRDAAIQLEQLWNELGKQHRFALFCAYPLADFGSESHASSFHGICSSHTRVLPAESYSSARDADERLRAITLLQQKAQSLEAEIAHRREVEKSLLQRESELADFFDNATEGLHKVAGDGTILWANQAECDLLGYTPQQYIGRSITEFHADADVIADIMARLEQGETLENYPARLVCKDGSIKHVRINSNAAFDEGKLVYTRCFSRDVTRQWLAEDALRQADVRKNEFLATLAHELRNPLAPIKSALQLLNMTTDDEAAAQFARDVISRQVRQLTRLVDDLLDVSRITRDKIALRQEPVEFGAVLRDAVETSRPGIESAGHQLTISIPDEPLMIDADRARLTQVFANLLNNSAQFTDPGGQIAVLAERVGSEIVVNFRDNGIGISCEELAYVFDIFRQADQSLERSHQGLGIGLTLVRRLVELHGGTVNAQSEGAGKGSTFVVRLPLSEISTRRAVTDQIPGDSPGRKQKVLVVDDNKDSGNTLSLYLRVKGHEVRTACDGLEAIELVEQFLPHVVLMDIGMPKLNGYEAARRIRELPCGKDIVIVALTGWGQASDIQRSLEAGCHAHLTKPVDLEQLDDLLAGARPASNR